MTEEPLAGAATTAERPRENDVYYVACRNSPGFCKLYDVETWERLGGGKSGCVAKVRSRTRRTFVVAKVLEHCGESTLARIADELRVVDTITSEYVVRVFGAHEADGLVWIEMEYVEGPTLRQVEDGLRSEDRWFSIPEAAELGLEMCKGLEDIHAAGAIHRDIKPENVVVPPSGRVKAKIVDFGIARFMDQERLTLTGEFKGTPEYSPPEYFKSRKPGDPPPRFGPEVDVYSFGVLLYRLFTGTKPFEVAGTHEVARAHLHVAPTPPQHVNPQLPRELCDLLLAMLSKKPEQRPSLDTIVEALTRAGRGSSGQTALAPKAPFRGLPMTVAAAVVGVAVIGVALGLRGPAKTSSGAAPGQPPVSSPSAVSYAGLGSKAGPTSMPRATASPETRFGARIEDEAVVLTNNTGQRARGFSISLFAPGSGRHVAQAPEEIIEPGGTLSVPLVFFEPPPTEQERFQRVELVVRDSYSGRLSVTLPLQ